MESEKRNFRIVAAAIGFALVVAAGCGGGKANFEVGEVGFSMKLPPGWGRGEPRASGGYTPTMKGTFFFEKAENDDPSGWVMHFPLEEASLTECVEKIVGEEEKMKTGMKTATKVLGKVSGLEETGEFKEAEKALDTRVISKTPKTIGGLEAIEVITEAPFSTLEVYLLKGNKVIWVNFRALKEDFPKYEKLFREASETIEIP